MVPPIHSLPSDRSVYGGRRPDVAAGPRGMMTMVPSASVDGRSAVPDAAHAPPRADSRSRPRGALGAGGDRVAAAVLLAPSVIGCRLSLGVRIGTSLLLSL